MKIQIRDTSISIHNTLRSAGYHPDRFQKEKQLSFSKTLLNDRYPRFHIYYDNVKKEINLHLDHKAPKYDNVSDHGAQYSGELVKQEAERLKSFF